jgi:hypothetical protein
LLILFFIKIKKFVLYFLFVLFQKFDRVKYFVFLFNDFIQPKHELVYLNEHNLVRVALKFINEVRNRGKLLFVFVHVFLRKLVERHHEFVQGYLELNKTYRLCPKMINHQVVWSKKFVQILSFLNQIR